MLKISIFFTPPPPMILNFYVLYKALPLPHPHPPLPYIVNRRFHTLRLPHTPDASSQHARTLPAFTTHTTQPSSLTPHTF
ncbi:hypothetical protein E2C01_011868 [Portunus trituberculatus]|uniref:Uncharacterized protein n=1 Tax=Portunus trituberculatus TaxID=210409 RepID=A0A5B7DC94_PORTR|nr:hypothetical protein [Portunus trituberculatus]